MLASCTTINIFYSIFIFKIEGTCPAECKCKSGSGDGSKVVGSNGYCNYHCSKGGYCGDAKNYKDGNAIDCTKCPPSPIGTLFEVLKYSLQFNVNFYIIVFPRRRL